MKRQMESGCGLVGRAVAFNSRDPRFDSSHRKNFIEHFFVNLFIINCIEKTKINKKRPGMAHFLKKTWKDNVNYRFLLRQKPLQNCLTVAQLISLGSNARWLTQSQIQNWPIFSKSFLNGICIEKIKINGVNGETIQSSYISALIFRPFLTK